MSPKEATEATTMSRALLSIMAKEGKLHVESKSARSESPMRAKVEAWVTT